MSQSTGDNSSNSHVHFHIGVPSFRIFNTYYVFDYVLNILSGVMPM